MDSAALIDSLRRAPDYCGQLVHIETLAPRPPDCQDVTPPLPDRLLGLLAAQGITSLFTHQAESISAARLGHDVVVVTGTASGKSLCYHLPVLEGCLADESQRALYLFPTKALAQDQCRGLQRLLAPDGELAGRLAPDVFDGDTPPERRRRIQASSQLVLSNPDMLHATILPQHPKWSRFFGGLQYVVIDEVHTYRGILGAHVACVLRRLRRICEHYGGTPQFLFASATIANPDELCSRLIGRPVQAIDQDGSPRGPKHFVLWDPRARSRPNDGSFAPADNGRSAQDDAVWWLEASLEAGAQAIAFTRTRQTAELIQRYAAERMAASEPVSGPRIRAYRGGYLPNERRQLESDLADGRLRAVATTNALELGIDIGSLDVAVLVGYPGTIASAWQQAGRSGRRDRESLAVLIAGDDPIDHYLMRHPDYFFSRTPEQAVVDPENPYVLAAHLRAAAFELPLGADELPGFGELAAPIAAALVDEGRLAEIAGRFYHSQGGLTPALETSLRHMSDNTISIVEWMPDGGLRSSRGTSAAADPGPGELSPSIRGPRTRGALAASRRGPGVAGGPDEVSMAGGARPINPGGLAGQRHGPGHGQRHGQRHLDHHQVIAQVDAISAPELVYREAVYLHQGETFLVRELDLEGKVAYVERRETDYYTQAVLESHVRVTGTRGERELAAGARLGHGTVDVTWRTIGFKKVRFGTRENIGYGPVDIPAQNLPTTAMWLVPDDELRRSTPRLGEALAGLRNLSVVALPLLAMCDSRDISGVVDSSNFGRPAMILYDRYPGGLGYCERGQVVCEELLELCRRIVTDCDCREGCPSCVGLPNLRPAIHSDPDLTRGYPIPDKDATTRLCERLCATVCESFAPECAQQP